MVIRLSASLKLRCLRATVCEPTVDVVLGEVMVILKNNVARAPMANTVEFFRSGELLSTPTTQHCLSWGDVSLDNQSCPTVIVSVFVSLSVINLEKESMSLWINVLSLCCAR